MANSARRYSDEGPTRRSGMSFAAVGGAEAAVAQQFVGIAPQHPQPPIPRLQLTAAEEKFRQYNLQPASAAASAARPGTASFATQLATSGYMGPSSRPATVGGQARPPLPKGLDLHKPVLVPSYTQYTPWYNDALVAKHTIIGRPVPHNASIATHSPRIVENTEKKREALEAIGTVLGRQIPPNLTAIVHTFLAQVPRLRTTDITAAAFTEALRDLDVVKPATRGSGPDAQADRHHLQRDESLLFADQLFQKLDVHKDGRVPLTTIIRVFDECINGKAFGAVVRRHCFELFNHQGYIHLTDLEATRQSLGRDAEFRTSGATSDMVRVLGDVFIEARRQEEIDFQAAAKKGKKGKAAKAKSGGKGQGPSMRISHLDFPLFSQYFDTNRELAAAFCPRWLRFLSEDPRLSNMVHVVALSLLEAEEIANRTSHDDL